MRALNEAAMAGVSASPALVESEAKARRELDLARKRLLAAMTDAITGGPEPPASPAGSAGCPPDGAS